MTTKGPQGSSFSGMSRLHTSRFTSPPNNAQNGGLTGDRTSQQRTWLQNAQELMNQAQPAIPPQQLPTAQELMNQARQAMHAQPVKTAVEANPDQHPMVQKALALSQQTTPPQLVKKAVEGNPFQPQTVREDSIRMDEKRAIARNLLREGLSVEIVARATGLSPTEVQKLQHN